MSIKSLTNDLITEVAYHLKRKDIINLCLTHPDYKHICNKSSLWKHVAFRDFKDLKETDKPSNISWKNFYWYWIPTSWKNISDDIIDTIITILHNRAEKQKTQKRKTFKYTTIYSETEDGYTTIIRKKHSIEEFFLDIYKHKKLKLLLECHLHQYRHEKFLFIGDLVDRLINRRNELLDGGWIEEEEE
jgi:hypothetical protein